MAESEEFSLDDVRKDLSFQISNAESLSPSIRKKAVGGMEEEREKERGKKRGREGEEDSERDGCCAFCCNIDQYTS